MNEKLQLLRADLKHEREILVVKRKIVRILEKLPDDRARRRVIIATAALCGLYDKP
jgi:hypothetical protein